MKLTACKYPSLNGAGVLFESYKDSVSSPDYEFGLVGNLAYYLLGVHIKSGLAWYWVVSDDGDVIYAPAAVFVGTSEVDFSDWRIVSGSDLRGGIQIVPVSFANLDRWFEAYLNDDIFVKSVVDFEVSKLMGS